MVKTISSIANNAIASYEASIPALNKTEIIYPTIKIVITLTINDSNAYLLLMESVVNILMNPLADHLRIIAKHETTKVIAKNNGVYGITTLTDNDCRYKDSKITIEFIIKIIKANN